MADILWSEISSGNFLCEAEKDQYDQTRVLMGLQSDLFHYPLQLGCTLKKLTKKVNDMGVQFGIWIEPESAGA